MPRASFQQILTLAILLFPASSSLPPSLPPLPLTTLMAPIQSKQRYLQMVVATPVVLVGRLESLEKSQPTTGLCESLVPRLRESRLLTPLWPREARSRNLGTTLLLRPVRFRERKVCSGGDDLNPIHAIQEMRQICG